MISPDAVVEPSAQISGLTSIGRGSVIEANTRLGERVVIGSNVVVGSGAIISADTAIKTGARVLPDAVVDSEVAARAIVGGNPATTVGFVDALEWPGENVEFPLTAGELVPIGLGSCAAMALNDVRDSRGSLLPIELTRDLPFIPRRLFFVHDVVDGGVRGQHAHRLCDQLLFTVAGAMTVVLDDGVASVQIRLDRTDVGIYLPRGVWVTHYQFTEQAVLAVLAELPYDPEETIGDYDEFLRWRTEFDSPR